MRVVSLYILHSLIINTRIWALIFSGMGCAYIEDSGGKKVNRIS